MAVDYQPHRERTDSADTEPPPHCWSQLGCENSVSQSQPRCRSRHRCGQVGSCLKRRTVNPSDFLKGCRLSPGSALVEIPELKPRSVGLFDDAALRDAKDFHNAVTRAQFGEFCLPSREEFLQRLSGT